MRYPRSYRMIKPDEMKNGIISDNSLVDGILNKYKSELGRQFEQYRNHVYRVCNFAVPYVDSAEDVKTLLISAAFHDLGIWTNRTFDYLEPSVNLALRFSAANNLNPKITSEIETIIRNHHKITRIQTSELAEIFRQADLVDLSLGLISCGRDPRDIRRIRKAFPNKGFHLNLTRLFIINLFKNPWNPLPMVKI